MVYRIYVEKKPGFDVEAQGLKNEIGQPAGHPVPERPAPAEPL